MSNSFSYEILQTLINKRKIWVLLGSLFVLFTITGFGVTLLGLILFWLHFNDLMITWWLITFTSRKAAKCWKRYRTTVAVSSRRLFWLLIKFWLLVFTNFWVKVIIVIQQVSWRPVAATGHNVSFCDFLPGFIVHQGIGKVSPWLTCFHSTNFFGKWKFKIRSTSFIETLIVNFVCHCKSFVGNVWRHI